MDKNNTFAERVEMMKYYQEEFVYRHKHYWEILTKMLIFNVVIIVLPIMSEAMGFSLSDSTGRYNWLFPILGVGIACLTQVILEDEAKKISAVNKAKYRINKTLPEEYRYVDYVKDKNDPKVQLAHHLVKIVFWMEILLCVIVLVVLYIDSIPFAFVTAK